MAALSVAPQGFTCSSSLTSLGFYGPGFDLSLPPGSLQPFTAQKTLELNCCGFKRIPTAVQELSGSLRALHMDDNPELQLDEQSAQLLIILRNLQTFRAVKSTFGWAGFSMANLTWLTERFRAASRSVQLVWC